MKFLFALALLVASFGPAQTPVQAQSGAQSVEPMHRVEVVVFRHASGRSDAHREEALKTFDAAVNPLLLKRLERRLDRQFELVGRAGPAFPNPLGPQTGIREADEDTTDEDTTDTDPAAEAGAGQPTIVEQPRAFVAIDGLSEVMAAAYRRLQSSNRYEPIASRAWYQPVRAPGRSRAVRIHDQSVILRERPTQDPNPAAFPADDDLADAASAVREHFRLDGTLQLSRRQHLGIALELHWREPAASSFRPSSSIQSGGDSGFNRNDGWETHRLVQSRVVREQRLEYFDSPLFGVLVYITRFKPLLPVPSPEPEPVSDPVIDPAPESGSPGTAPDAGEATGSSTGR